MIRIMSWNIERFGLEKFLTTKWDKAGQRQVHISNTIRLAQPHVLIFIEVQTNQRPFGNLIGGLSGPLAATKVLNDLRAEFPAQEWMLIPPAILTPNLGYSEGIAVLFRADTLKFEGPWRWTVGGIRDPAEAGVVPTPYTDSWAAVLPALPSHDNPLINQNRLAGQYKFFNGPAAAGIRWQFGDNNARSIWRTRFYVPATNRHLEIFSLHFRPQLHLALDAICELARVTEVGAALGAAEDRVIVGDFNINVNAPRQEAYFRQLTGGPRARRRAPLCPVPYQRLFGPGSMTHVRRVGNGHTKGAAPFYGYATLNKHNNALGIDNALVARGGGAAAANNQAVVNRILGTPAPAAGAPGYPVEMGTTIQAINENFGVGSPRKRHFNTIANFGHIGGGSGSSDHLAIVFELP